MTLMNGLVHAGRALLWTDTRGYHPHTGETLCTVAKAFRGELWPWAAVHSGVIDGRDPMKIANRVGHGWPLSGERLLERAQEALRLEAEEGRIGRLLIAYACPERGARMFHIANDDLPFAAPYEPYETVEFMSSGNGEPWAAEFAGKDLTPDDMRRFIDLQVGAPCQTVMGWSGRTIGGDVIEIEITADDVEHRVLRAV